MSFEVVFCMRFLPFASPSPRRRRESAPLKTRFRVEGVAFFACRAFAREAKNEGILKKPNENKLKTRRKEDAADAPKIIKQSSIFEPKWLPNRSWRLLETPWRPAAQQLRPKTLLGASGGEKTNFSPLGGYKADSERE